MKKRRTGFTIVELLIVITIIAILSTIATMSYRTLSKQSRDKSRSTDVSVIQNSLEKYYGKNGEYLPPNTTPNYPNGNNEPNDLVPNNTTVKTSLELKDEDVNGPITGDTFFQYPFCLTSNSNCTRIVNADTKNLNQYLYITTIAGNGTTTPVNSFFFDIGTSGASCTMTIENTTGTSAPYTNPIGYFIAWHREADGNWIFSKGLKGKVTASGFNDAGQCTFTG